MSKATEAIRGGVPRVVLKDGQKGDGVGGLHGSQRRRSVELGTTPKQKQNGVLAIVVVVVSVAFAWTLWPFFGAILWSVLLSVIFAPFYQLLLAWMPHWRNVAASVTVLLIALLVIFPLAIVTASLIQEVRAVFERVQSGQIDLRASLSQLRSHLPGGVANFVSQLETAGLDSLIERFSTALLQGGQFIATRVLSLGQATANLLLNIFVMLYLLFFLLRDREALLQHVQGAVPLASEQQQLLFSKFTATVRGTLKSDLLVAFVQGVLGGLIFWLLNLGTPVLWGTVMAVFSLLPVVGTGLVWVPAATYLLVTGSVWQGIILLAYGALILSMVDDILRPLLIGKGAKMPSYIVLLSSLGGIATLGANGFVVGPLVAAFFLAVWEMRLQINEA